MMDFDELRKKWKDKLADLYERRGDATPEVKGTYTNLIKDAWEELRKIDVEEQLYSAKRPGEVKIYCYVIVSNKETVKKNIGSKFFDFIEPDRYDETKIENWKPFSSGQNIHELLEKFRERFPFEVFYLDGKPADEILIKIDDNKSHSILIIDVLSLFGDNEYTARSFDTEKAAGVLTPICRRLTQHEDVYDLMEKIRDNVFRTLNIKMKDSGCYRFESNVPAVANFIQRLQYIYQGCAPIKNTIGNREKSKPIPTPLFQ
jgi:hypothetical protein